MASALSFPGLRIVCRTLSFGSQRITTPTLLSSRSVRQSQQSERYYSGTGEPYTNLIVEARGAKGNVGYIQLNRRKKHNAISPELSAELFRALEDFERDDKIGAVVYTGGERIFTVGADISVMGHFTYPSVLTIDCSFSLLWNKLYDFRKPIIAAVNGFCVGGGTETVMMCDIIFASEKTQFGQPEINIGTLPGAGGTQRLTRAVGKSKAMELILTGEKFSAQKALDWGLISKVFPAEDVIPEAIKLAEEIAAKPRVAALMAKEAVKLAYEVPLSQGLRIEKAFALTLPATKDFKEGTSAFIEKRQPHFTD